MASFQLHIAAFLLSEVFHHKRRLEVRFTSKLAGSLFLIAALAAGTARAQDRSPADSVAQTYLRRQASVGADPRPANDTAGQLQTIATETAPDSQSSPSPRSQEKSSGAAEKKPGLFRRWLRMADETKAKQPDWLSPLATTSGRLKQELRYDMFDQPAVDGNRLYQLGGNKGFEFITSSRTQLLLGVPTYNLQSPNGPPAGFGDLPVQLKFRIASAQRGEGNYLLTFIIAATVPTGAHLYGSGDAVLTPTLALGKGWGCFDLQSTIGENLPAGSTTRLGRQVLWNTAFQYDAGWKLWPELEVNSTFYETGKNAGAKQVFLTPGFGFGRVRLHKRLHFSSAAGMQIAATRFHTYNHRWLFSERLSF
jgi:hypothetical protein